MKAENATNRMARASDPETSHTAARDVLVRAGTQRYELLKAYRLSHAAIAQGGLTDEQAGDWTRISLNRRSCYWRRCSDLRQGGYIADTGRTQLGSAGSRMRLCAITPKGLALLEQP